MIRPIYLCYDQKLIPLDIGGKEAKTVDLTAGNLGYSCHHQPRWRVYIFLVLFIFVFVFTRHFRGKFWCVTSDI